MSVCVQMREREFMCVCELALWDSVMSLILKQDVIKAADCIC